MCTIRVNVQMFVTVSNKVFSFQFPFPRRGHREEKNRFQLLCLIRLASVYTVTVRSFLRVTSTHAQIVIELQMMDGLMTRQETASLSLELHSL